MFEDYKPDQINELRINRKYLSGFDIDALIKQGYTIHIVNDLEKNNQELFYDIILKGVSE